MEGSACLSLKIGADRWLSGQKQQTVNLPAHAVYGGSNPPLSTISEARSWKPSAAAGEGSFQFRFSNFQFRKTGGSNSVVESQPSKLLVAGSIPVSRSNLRSRRALGARATVGAPLPLLNVEVDQAYGRRADLSAEARREGESANAGVAQLAER